jgi:hypothetical protein
MKSMDDKTQREVLFQWSPDRVQRLLDGVLVVMIHFLTPSRAIQLKAEACKRRWPWIHQTGTAITARFYNRYMRKNNLSDGSASGLRIDSDMYVLQHCSVITHTSSQEDHLKSRFTG